MILVDTSIWIDHFRTGVPVLVANLMQDQVAMHDHILGELALGSLKNRVSVLGDLANLPRAPLAMEDEVRAMIEARRLYSRGIGYTDAHLLASALLDGSLSIWTKDARLAAVAGELGVKF